MNQPWRSVRDEAAAVGLHRHAYRRGAREAGLAVVDVRGSLFISPSDAMRVRDVARHLRTAVAKQPDTKLKMAGVDRLAIAFGWPSAFCRALAGVSVGGPRQ
jgi:hypothetical protein